MSYLQASLIAQLVNNLPAMQETLVRLLVRKIHWRKDRLPTPVFLDFPCGSAGKESTCNAGELGSIPGLGRSAEERIGYPLQYSWASLVAHLVKNSPAMRETWVQPLGWRRERLPTPVFWPGEFRGPYSPWGRKESDTTERLSLYFTSLRVNTESLCCIPKQID